MRRLSIGIIGLFGCALVAVSGSTAAAQNPGGNPDAAKIKNPVAASPDSVKAGQASYQKYCRFCHGDTAKGDGKMAPQGSHPSDLTDAKWERGATDGEIYTVIKEGAAPKFEMKGFKSKMTDQEIWNVVNYLRSIQAK